MLIHSTYTNILCQLYHKNEYTEQWKNSNRFGAGQKSKDDNVYVLTQKLNGTGTRTDASPKKSQCLLVLQNGLSRTSGHMKQTYGYTKSQLYKNSLFPAAKHNVCIFDALR
jgi:hypothetical protein